MPDAPAASPVEATQSSTIIDSAPPSPAPGRFSPGDLITDRFIVVRHIANGGMGEVYEVEDRLLHGVHVALKLIRPSIADDPAFSHRFEQEVILARKLSHPNLCPIYDISRSNEPPASFLFLTMKLVQGETLSSRMRRNAPFTRTEKLSISRQLVEGLAAIHAGGIIHRDIKPNNVMLDMSGSEPWVVIMDFGLARLDEPENAMSTRTLVAGTPGYMAPEMVNEGPSAATDLFALGVLLHQVFTGVRPSVAPDTGGAKPFSALDSVDLPAALKDAVKELLAPEPMRRRKAFRLLQATSGSGELPRDEHHGQALGAVSDRPVSRRQFVAGSVAAAAAVAAGGVRWKWEQLYDVTHPLPAKRFVALLNWPSPDPSVKPILMGIIDAIGRELARAEAYDRNLLVLPAPDQATSSNIQLHEMRESLGANLILAASAKPTRSGEFRLALHVLDPSSASSLRSRELRVSKQQQASLPEKAVRAAASLLSIRSYEPDDDRIQVGTANPEAFAAFRDAEALRKQENDTGLEQSIQKYQQAIDLDPTYAVAHAKLAWAYLREYALNGNPAAIALANLNCKAAIQRQPRLVDAHLGLASILEITGDTGGAMEELSQALSLDPSDPHTLTYQANFYARDNRWELAERTFARVLALRPNYWLGHQELGVLLDAEGKYHNALVEFRTASLAAPGNALAIKNTGSVYFQLGQLAQASEYLNKSYAISPVSSTATGLAELARAQHQHAAALTYAQQALKTNANSPDVWLELADVYLTAGRHAQAEQAYREAAERQDEDLRTSPKDGPKWMCLALCRAKTGQIDSAVKLIAKAEANNADDMDSQLLKVRILELVGRRNEALTTIARCLDRGPVQFMLQIMPDLEKIRTTAEYKSIVASSALKDQG